MNAHDTAYIEARERIRATIKRRRMVRRLHLAALQLLGLILGMVGAVAWVALIAILCGY